MRTLRGLLLTALVAAVAWFAVGRGILDDLNESNARSGGGGPQSQRIVNARRFAPVVAKVQRVVGAEAKLSLITMRPDSVEFEVVRGGRARGYRWREGDDGLRTYEVGGTGQAGAPSARPWPMSLLDTHAPGRIAAAASAAEHGDFHLSIGTMERADSGRVVWIMRGTIGERGVAYSARPDGSHVKAYNPASPELSAGARLGQCIQGARSDPARLQRCVQRFGGR
jgi:hypothetical protein